MFFDLANTLKLLTKNLPMGVVGNVIPLATTYFSPRMKIETRGHAFYTRLVPHGTQVKGKPAVMSGRNASGLEHGSR